ncbi:FHIPEP family type III secretion protein [Escherichia coli]
MRETSALSRSQYAIFINGIKADEADIPADKLMALPSSETYGEIDGGWQRPGVRDAGDLIQPAQKAKALNMGYQVIDSASAIATHVNKIVRSYIPDLFNYDDITQLHNRLSSMAPRLAGRFKRGAELQPVAESVPRAADRRRFPARYRHHCHRAGRQ